MSLYFICGKVGAGKSYRGVVSIVDQLVHDDRLIVTNLPVNLGKLADFLAKRYPEHNICLLDHRRPANPGEEADADGMVFEPSRVRVLDEGELAEFYRIRHQASDKVPRIERERKIEILSVWIFRSGLKAASFPVTASFTIWTNSNCFTTCGDMLTRRKNSRFTCRSIGSSAMTSTLHSATAERG